MYNEDYKREFLQNVENPVMYERQFTIFEPFEETYEKDLYDFTVSQILTVYKSIGTTSSYFLYHINNRNTRYAEYALNKNLVKDGQNHFEEIKTEVLLSCLDKAGIRASVITRDEMRVYTSKLLNAQDKYLFWACFEGIDGTDHNEITRLKVQDIDEKAKTAKLISGRIVKVSDELILAAKEAQEATFHYKYISSNNTGYASETNLVSGDGIWKAAMRKNMVDTDAAKGMQVYKTLNKCIQYLDLPHGYLTVNSLRQSGLIDYIQRLAKEKNESCYNILYKDSDTFELIKNQYEFTINQRAMFYKKYKEYFDGTE